MHPAAFGEKFDIPAPDVALTQIMSWMIPQ